MKGILTFVVVFVVVAAAPFAGAAQSATVPQSSGGAQPSGASAQDGRTLFTAYGCFECHGREAQGGATGPRIARPAGVLSAFTAYLRHPADNMPPYTAKVLPDKDAGDIYAFLKSIPSPKPAKDVPLLNQ